ncbi:TonB-dependent hemoglobin/transferrin/lactoferrin family receptor [Azonexus sp.]|uniref:TonB-dependent hemoglobin/transferrin/lactoferrin family receptor n=1 Tax=Azonexus sp. TaxID=1872668 RepID=UPI0027BB1B1F|nr:TonB-dependent hemoglobin/transferrin/lactoferrin family receptor [Azonexus sp.]
MHICSRFVLRTIPLALFCAYPTLPALAADTTLQETVVSASRREARIDDTTATVSKLTREQMDRRPVLDEADLFRDEPDVAMGRNLGRFGPTRVNIRGIEDNRVIQMVDGFRQPDYYNGGGATNFTVSAVPSVMPDFLRQAEVVRGPASSLYGSDALGGVVGYITLSPEDIAPGEKKSGLRLRGAWSDANDGFSGSVIGALKGEQIDLLFGYAQGRSDETENPGKLDITGPTRSKANPTRTDDRGAIAKIVVRPSSGHKFTAAVEGREQDTQTAIRRIPSSLPRVSSMLGDDTVDRRRVSLEYEHTPSGMFYDRMILRAFNQTSDTHNHNQQIRSNTTAGCSGVSSGSNTCLLEQDFYFEQENTGFGAQFESGFRLAGSEHLLTYGVDLMRQEVATKRDANVRNQTSNTTSKSLAGENYPLRDFANGRTESVGLFVQDEITLPNSPLKLTPGLRYDHTRLKPEVDALAQQVLTVNNRQAIEQKHSAVSPKLGALWEINQNLAMFGQIASGFRAPNYSEVNGNFRNTSQGYGTTPNPDLNPEKSIGVELGIRAKAQGMRGQFAVFDNRYRDFIETVRLSCPSSALCIPGIITYASVNLSKVRIYGAELRGSWDISPNWRIDAALAYAHGTNEETGQPLNSVEPMRLSSGIAYDTGVWGAEARWRLAQAQKRVDETGGRWFKPAGYGVTDLSVWFRPSKETRIVASVNNLFDKKYWLWSDIRQADSTNPQGVDFYAQPGRNFRISLQADF